MYEIVTKEGFRAVGLSWEGTFQQAAAGEIREVIKTMVERENEISNKVNPQQLLGLSNHKDTESNRFSHYSVVEVYDDAKVPAGMEEVKIPTLRYVKIFHPKDEDIKLAYTNIYEWIKQNGYELHTNHLTHFEIYPMTEEAYSSNPPFTIMIPIK